MDDCPAGGAEGVGERALVLVGLFAILAGVLAGLEVEGALAIGFLPRQVADDMVAVTGEEAEG